MHRDRADAALVVKELKDAEASLRAGGCLIVYPEGTASRDPDLWPMVGKTGVARLALTTGAPVIPVAHWGAQAILPYGSTKPHLVPRHLVRMLAGPPVDLSAYRGQPLGREVLRGATAAVMADITGLLAQLRGKAAPGRAVRPGRRPPRQGGQGRPGGGHRRSDGGARRAADGAARRRPVPEGGAGVSAAVMGAGMWGTTFAQVLCDAGTPAVLWGRRAGAGRGDQPAP